MSGSGLQWLRGKKMMERKGSIEKGGRKERITKGGTGKEVLDLPTGTMDG